MTSAAFFLITRNIRNRIRRSIARIRQPRYLLGTAMAGLYFWTFFFRHSRVRVGGPPVTPVYTGMMGMVISVLALIIIIGAWALPANEPGLVFSEAEIQFFFPGPVTRRQLLAYKVLRSQVQIFFTSIIFSLFAFRGAHLFGVWLGYAALDVYLTFTSFARARMRLGGFGLWPRLIAVSIVATAILAVANRQIHAHSSAIMQAFRQGGQAGFKVLDAVVSTPPLSTILYVPRMFGSLLYAPHPYAVAAIVAAAGLALFFVTTQIDVAFEDASIVASQRSLARRARKASFRSGRSTTAVNRMRPLFQLAETGRPEMALIWKNLIGAMRLTAFPLFALIMPLFAAAIAAVFRKQEGIGDIIGIMGLMSTAMIVFIGPRAVRTDLRTDILRLDVIKTFPVSAESLLIGELGASLLVISAFEVLMLIASVTILDFWGHHYPKILTSPEFVVSALVFAIPVSAIQLLIQNGAIILFPAWNVNIDESSRFSAMGQRLLMFIGNAVSLGIAMIPAAILFFPSLWLVHRFFGGAPFGIVLATIPPAAVLTIESVLAVKFLAAQFEDIDIANDLAV